MYVCTHMICIYYVCMVWQRGHEFVTAWEDVTGAGGWGWKYYNTQVWKSQWWMSGKRKSFWLFLSSTENGVPGNEKRRLPVHGLHQHTRGEPRDCLSPFLHILETSGDPWGSDTWSQELKSCPPVPTLVFHPNQSLFSQTQGQWAACLVKCAYGSTLASQGGPTTGHQGQKVRHKMLMS